MDVDLDVDMYMDVEKGINMDFNIISFNEITKVHISTELVVKSLK